MNELTFETGTNLNNPNYNNVTPLFKDKYIFMTHSYEGTGGYADGTYLFPFLRESFYGQRKQMCSYRNFIRPLINSLIEPVFNAPIVRETNNNLYKKFIESPDGLSTMDEFSKDVAQLSRLHGTVFIVMDNYLASEMPTTEDEAISNRILPFVYIQPAFTVSAYTNNKFKQLTSITFYAEILVDGKPYQKYTTWDDMDTTIEIRDGDKLISTEIITHGLGVLPVIQVNSVCQADILPTPQFHDVAKINLAVFNKDSEIRDQERAQAFSIFYMQTDQNSNNTTIGPHNAIMIPADDKITIVPGYASPDSSILTVLMANNKELIDSIYKIAENNGITAVKQASSGIAESYRFISKNAQLIKTALLCETFERRLAEVFSAYINQEVELLIRYSRDYSPSITIDNIDATIKLLNLDIPDEVKKTIKKELVSKTLDYLDSDELKELINLIDIEETGKDDINNTVNE